MYTHERLQTTGSRSFDGDDILVLHLGQQLNLVQDFLLRVRLAGGFLDHYSCTETDVGSVYIRFIAMAKEPFHLEFILVQRHRNIHTTD
jgi:hypothetical protein